LELQEQLAQQRLWSYEECTLIAEALVSSKSPAGIRTLIQSVLACPDASTSDKIIVLNVMREAKAKDWEGELFELVKPYLQDIESSVPTIVSD
jgi:hypothetical protein